MGDASGRRGNKTQETDDAGHGFPMSTRGNEAAPDGERRGGLIPIERSRCAGLNASQGALRPSTAVESFLHVLRWASLASRHASDVLNFN